MINPKFWIKQIAALAAALSLLGAAYGSEWDNLPIADVHVHYSHDSVDLTPPERVIELMRNANIKFALVSSSDDNGTQLLAERAPDLIVPGLRPYRRRGELGTWFINNKNLEYVERLLETNRYASLGEFHLYGNDADLDIPRRIVELAVEHNLVLHAHADADAVERLVAQDPTVKVLWAHSGFDSPEAIANMLSKHDRLWADLAFRSDVGSGGELTPEWISLFSTYPDRLMLGTDTYTPERMYFLPEHAANARRWLSKLPIDLARRLAWENAHDLLMPHWQANRQSAAATHTCAENGNTVAHDSTFVNIEPLSAPAVSAPFSVAVTVCGDFPADADIQLSAVMPAHGHGMNYAPEHNTVSQSSSKKTVNVDGVVLHMPGQWQWRIELRSGTERTLFTKEFDLR